MMRHTLIFGRLFRLMIRGSLHINLGLQYSVLVCLVGSIEEKIYQRQVSKQGLSGTVVDLSKKAEHTSFSAEELRDLFSFEPNTTCLTHDLLDCQCTGDGNTPGK